MRFIVAVCFVVVLPLLAFSQQHLTWQDITGPAGINTIVNAGDGNLFATNGRGVVYESMDGGDSWFAILAYPSSTPIDELVVNGSHVVVHLTDFSIQNSLQVLIWNNTPHSWSRIFAARRPPQNFFDFRSIMVDDSGKVFLLSIYEGQVYRYSPQTGFARIGSAQGFLSPTTENFPTLVSVIDHQDRIYFGSSRGGLYISPDTGKSWRATLPTYSISAIDVSHPDRLVVAASPSENLHTNGGVFSSADSGKSWVGLGLEEKTISSLASDNNGNLLALADGGIYKYDGATKTWKVTNQLQNAFTTLLNVGEDFIAASEDAGLTRSFDGGNTWSGALIRGKDVFALTVTPHGNLLAGTLGNGVYRSSLGSSLWSATPSGTMADYIYDFVQTADAVVAGTDDGVYRSTDDGQNWQKTNDSTLAGPAYAVRAMSDGTLFAGTLFGVLRSSDGGHEWRTAGNLPSKVLFMDVSQAGEILAAPEDQGMYLSSDRGETWRSLGLARNDIQTVRFAPSGDFLVGVYGGVYLSTNRGASWNYHSVNATAYTYVLAFGAGQSLYAGTYQGVFESTDGGSSWTAAGDSGMTTNTVLALNIAPDGSLLAGTYRGGVYKSKQTAFPPVVEGVEPEGKLPLSMSLAQNYPNPFNPSTRFEFHTAGREMVSLRVFDLLGREVATIIDGEVSPGMHDVLWDARGIASGTYFYRLQTRASTLIRKLMIMK